MYSTCLLSGCLLVEADAFEEFTEVVVSMVSPAGGTLAAVGASLSPPLPMTLLISRLGGAEDLLGSTSLASSRALAKRERFFITAFAAGADAESWRQSCGITPVLTGAALPMCSSSAIPCSWFVVARETGELMQLLGTCSQHVSTSAFIPSRR